MSTASLLDPAELKLVVDGTGPTVLFIHGTAADHTTWSMQRPGLRDRLRLLLYDRRGCGQSPQPENVEAITVGGHAEDAANVLRLHGGGEPIVVCGSSFGGVVALELIRRHPELVRAAILIEPPLPPSDDVPPAFSGFVGRFDAIAARDGGPAAAEFFLRTVLGDAAYERIPKPFQERSKAMWEAIRRDCVSLGTYHVGYDRLGEVWTPVVLVGGDRSAALYRPTLEALERALPEARLEVLVNAGHMAHADAYRRFNALVREVALGG